MLGAEDMDEEVLRVVREALAAVEPPDAPLVEGDGET
jgi:hypothetical protein